MAWGLMCSLSLRSVSSFSLFATTLYSVVDEQTSINTHGGEAKKTRGMLPLINGDGAVGDPASQHFFIALFPSAAPNTFTRT
jgi:hypothetical protein